MACLGDTDATRGCLGRGAVLVVARSASGRSGTGETCTGSRAASGLAVTVLGFRIVGSERGVNCAVLASGGGVGDALKPFPPITIVPGSCWLVVAGDGCLEVGSAASSVGLDRTAGCVVSDTTIRPLLSNVIVVTAVASSLPGLPLVFASPAGLGFSVEGERRASILSILFLCGKSVRPASPGWIRIGPVSAFTIGGGPFVSIELLNIA